MATVSQKEWKKYIARLRQINDKAAEDFKKFIIDRGGYGNIERQKLIDYAYGISTKYGEASAALSSQMYDAVAELSGAAVPAAVPAETATYSEVAKTVNGIIKNTENEDILVNGIGRLVKMAGTDTMLSNAYRDRGKGSKSKHSGAQVAWIPSGDTCPFCLMLASKGWQKQTEWGANNHSEHIHVNCDCTYMVRFNNDLNVEGYDPERLKEDYMAAGDNRKDRLNAMRREEYAENKDKINAQKRAAYAKRNDADVVKLADEYIRKSVGAKTNSYDIMDLKTGNFYHLAEGTYLRDKEVFAGKGSKKVFNKAEDFAEKYGGNPNEWMHVKGYGTIETEDGNIDAEIHWSECQGIGKVELFIKEWFE